jgi:hypothetical protein
VWRPDGGHVFGAAVGDSGPAAISRISTLPPDVRWVTRKVLKSARHLDDSLPTCAGHRIASTVPATERPADRHPAERPRNFAIAMLEVPC